MTALRVGVDALFAVPQRAGGIWTYMRALMRDLPACDPATRYDVYTNRDGAGQLDLAPGGAVREVVCPVSGRVRVARLAYEYGVLPAQAWRRGTDVLFAPSFTLPAALGAAAVVTIHDMRHEDLPQTFSAAYGAILRRLARRAARRADCVLTVSEDARSRLLACYGLDPGRVIAAPLAADDAFFARATDATRARVRARYGLRAPYVFSVAQPSWHKNLAVLVEAYIAWRKRADAPLQLVLAGWKRPEDAPDLWAKVRAAGVADDVCLTGWVPDDALPALYQGASVCVVPSRYEGFGIPVLEAMAGGTPVITTTATALPEVAGDAALLFAPDDCRALLAAMRHILGDDGVRASLAARGRERARRFTWRRTAERTHAALVRAHAERTKATKAGDTT